MEFPSENVDDIEEQVIGTAMAICTQAMSTPDKTVTLGATVSRCVNGGHHVVFKVDEQILWNHIHWPSFQDAESFKERIYQQSAVFLRKFATRVEEIRAN